MNLYEEFEQRYPKKNEIFIIGERFMYIRRLSDGSINCESEYNQLTPTCRGIEYDEALSDKIIVIGKVTKKDEILDKTQMLLLIHEVHKRIDENRIKIE